MVQVLDYLTNTLNGIGALFTSLSSFEINSKTYRYIAWILKIIAQIVEIVLGGILLGTEIYPNLAKIKSSPNHSGFKNPEGYRLAADLFIYFFTMEMFLDLVFWCFMLKSKGGRHTSVVVSLLLSIFCDMPIMICGICLMNAKGTISWDDEKFNLVFQIWYIVNIMLQITADSAETVRYWGVIIVAPLSYLIGCMPYAFVVIPMSGWHWFQWYGEYYKNKSRFVHGTFKSSDTQNMLDFLIISGFIGQGICSAILILAIFALLIVCYIGHDRVVRHHNPSELCGMPSGTSNNR